MPTTLPTTSPAFIPLLISPFVLLLLAIPILLLSEYVVRKVKWLGNSNIPAPVLGGLVVAILVLLLRLTAGDVLRLDSSTSDVLWHYLITPKWDFGPVAARDVTRPLLILFFTCVGLNASYAVAKKGSRILFVYLGLATVLAVLQYAAGMITAVAVGASPLLGVMCSGVSLMGGFATAAGFAPEFEKQGLAGAQTIGLAAAAFGVVAGGLLAGPLAQRLMSLKVAAVTSIDPRTSTASSPEPDTSFDEGGFVDDLISMQRRVGATLVHLLVLFVCLKLGAFFSVWIEANGTPLVRMIPGVAGDYRLAFPLYMGSMILAVLVRNLHDAMGLKWIESRLTDVIASFVLSWLLCAIIMDLKLASLLSSAAPMLLVLLVQVVIMAAFAYFVVFRVMGRNYDAVAMSAGMVGFGLGATSNAVASMRALARRYGPAPQAFLVVTVVGAFLIDFINAILITILLNVFRI